MTVLATFERAMYGLMWGEDGVGRVLDILKDEIDINLRLLGATSIKGLNSSHVSNSLDLHLYLCYDLIDLCSDTEKYTSLLQVNASRLEHWSYKVPMLNPSKVHGGRIRQSKL